MKILKNLKLPTPGNTRTEEANRTRTSHSDEAKRTSSQTTPRSRDIISRSKEVDEGESPRVGAIFKGLSGLFDNSSEAGEITKTADAVVEAKRRAERSPSSTQTHTADVLADALADTAVENPNGFAEALVDAETQAARTRDGRNEIPGVGGVGGALAHSLQQATLDDRVEVLNQAFVDATTNDPALAEELARALKEARAEQAKDGGGFAQSAISSLVGSRG